ncbi:cytochrome P450 2G1-like [Octodon degus]|uniref:Cytochrome P450 n=1 Tax=Octodon degus TaxID=10160 RepID=A0A6P3G0F8_OCTDE|nr:cytochrome P450 2G1-like [Octodon degus]
MELGGAFTIFLTLCLTCLILLIAWKRADKGGKLPPGPTPLPFLGNMLQIGYNKTYESLLKLHKKYGPVFTVYMGPRPVVVLCGYDALKEALADQGDYFNGRGEMPSVDRNFQSYGVAMASGERWKILRRFSLSILRDFGMGKRSIEERIQEEAGFLLEELRKTKGAPIDTTLYLSRTVSNVISSIVFGSRFDYEDKQFQTLLAKINESFTEMSRPWAQLYEMYSGIMKYLPGRHKYLYNLIEEIKEFAVQRIKISEASFNPQNPQNFIDHFLIKMHQEKNNPDTEFNTQNLITTTVNLFFAGTETVSSTLRYGILLLMKHPDVEAKVYEEIRQVIGPHKIPSVNDRPKMPYTNAVIHEIQRMTNIVPMGVPHVVTQHTHFRGYFLPKGTDVYPLIGSVLQEPKNFRYPNVFYPQHFLDEQGCFKKNEAFIPFSHGKRNCLGESLARMELFIYFTAIIQNFSLRSVVPLAEVDITHQISGFGNIPPPYQVCFIAR